MVAVTVRPRTAPKKTIHAPARTTDSATAAASQRPLADRTPVGLPAISDGASGVLSGAAGRSWVRVGNDLSSLTRGLDRAFVRRDKRRDCDPAIAEARHRADQALLAPGIIERPARTRQCLAEQGVAHIDATPHRADQFIAAHHALAFFEQVNDAVKRLQRQRNDFTIAAQFAQRNVEFEAFEAVTP